MNDEKMLITVQNLLAAVEMMYNDLPEGLTKKAVYGRLKAVDKTIAELRGGMQPIGEPQPPLNKTDCYTPLLDMQPKQGCRVCGGTMVFIRGKYPGADKREVCPTCAWERLEQINEISQPNYGMAYKSNGV